jgi:hypothetical protein
MQSLLEHRNDKVDTSEQLICTSHQLMKNLERFRLPLLLHTAFTKQF